MALSGTLTGTCVANNGASSRYDYKIEWSATQNVNANQSTITATAYVRSNNSSYSTSTNWTSVINGSTVKTFNYHVQASAGWVNFGSKTWTVNHNADGTCTTSISGSFSGTYNGSYVLRSGSVSGNITLNTIPRASSFTLNRSSATIGSDQITVSISRASSSFTHTVIYKFGSITADQATKTSATSVSFTPQLSDCSQIPNATSGTATIVVDTYNGSTKVGTASRTITLNVPSSVVPSCGISVTGNNLLGGQYVGGKSTVTVGVTNATGSYGSTIKSYSITGGGLNSTSQSATSGTLSAGSHDLTVKVTDSRGRSYSKTQKITVHSYSTPTLSAKIYRSNSVGEAINDGTYVHADITVNVNNIGSANINAKQYKIDWKKSTDSNWSTLVDWTNMDKYSTSWKHNLGSGWSTTVSYDVRINVKDSYTTVNVIGSISTIACLFNIEKGGIGVGKVHERGVLDVSGDIYMNGAKVMSANHPVSGNWFKGIPTIGSDGVMEVGKYIDFHNTNNSTSDYTARLTDNGGTIESSGSFKANGGLFVQNARVGALAGHGGLDIGESSRAMAICSSSQPTWWNGSTSHQLVYSTKDSGGYPMIMSDNHGWIRTPPSGLIPNTSGTGSGRSNIGSTTWRFSTGYFNVIDAVQTLNVGVAGSDYASGLVANRYLNGKQQSAKCMIINTGGGCAALLHRDETNGYEAQVLVQVWDSATNGCFRPHKTGAIENGTSAYKWKVVYANNGTVQTSDERFKIKRGFANIDDCFEMVKNIDVYNYIMLDQDKSDFSKNQLGKMAMKNSEEEVNIQMGVIAQDLQKYECGKQILVEGEYEHQDGTMDKMLHINPYNMTTAVLSALKVEIQKREELEKQVEELKVLIGQGV